jgi:DNA-binding transcriptional regulator YdaS (Cro superfamily)
MNTNPFLEIVRLVGSEAELARRISAELPEGRTISPQAVSKWTRRIPANRCLLLERLVEQQVTRHQMRPDVFGPEHQRAA